MASRSSSNSTSAEDGASLRELKPLEAADGGENEQAPKHRSKVILVCAGLNSFLVMSAITLMLPFFAGETLEKFPSRSGMDVYFAIGMVFSIATFVEFLAAPLMAKDLPHTGSKLMLVLSSMEICALLLLFSCVNRIHSWSVFVTLCLAIRFFQGISTAANFVSSFSMLLGAYPESKGLVNGVLRSGNTFGYATGTVFGGLLYDWGGFALPFYVGGVLLFVNAISLMIVLPSSESEVSITQMKANVSFMELLSVPWVWMILATIFLTSVNLGYLEPTLAVYLKESLNLPAAYTYAGIGLFVYAIFYCGPAIPVGHWIDSGLNPRLVQAVGLVLSGIGCQLIGPAPFLPFQRSLVWSYCALMIIGLGNGAALVAASPDLLNTLHARDLGSPAELRAAVAGLYQAAMSLGYGAGPIFGTTVTAAVGFECSASILGAVLLVWCALFSMGAVKSDVLLMSQLKNIVRGGL